MLVAINVNAANNQAGQLNNNISQLRNAKKQMLAYKSSVSNNWQGKEVGYILTAIDQVVGDIDSAIRNLDSLSNDIKNTAAQIKREEDAAAAAARAAAAKQQRIRTAQAAYDNAREELDDLIEKREKLEARQKKASFLEKIRIANELQDLNKEIEKAESKCENAYNALRAAKR